MKITHIDTCLSCYVLDHCNGETELLLGVPVDGSTRYWQVKAALRDEIRASEKAGFAHDSALAALDIAFDRVHPFKTFDRTLEPANDDGVECFAWFRFDWEPYEDSPWRYEGDVSLECGGFFWREDGSEDYVLCVDVTPCSDAGGPSNVWWIESGSIYLPPEPEKRLAALSIIGETVDDNRAKLVYATKAYAGIEKDRGETLQIGPDEEAREEVRPDKRLRTNADLRKYVEREWL